MFGVDVGGSAREKERLVQLCTAQIDVHSRWLQAMVDDHWWICGTAASVRLGLNEMENDGKPDLKIPRR